MERPLSYYDNFIRVVQGSGPEWVPYTLDIGALQGLTEPVLRRFYSETHAERPEEFFNYDSRTFSLQGRFNGGNPVVFHGSIPSGTTFDEWGIGHWAGGAEATYEKMYSPLASAQKVDDIKRYPSPVIELPDDITSIDEYKKRGYPVFGYAGSIYEWSWWLRGMENFMTDLILRPDMSEALIQKVAEYVKKLAFASAGAGINVLCFYDDVGMQTGLQISPGLWRKFIKPRWQNILQSVREQYPDVVFFLHSCGNITEIVPDIVAIGFDILHPVQPECMDIAAVRNDFGSDIALCATISAQKTFPFGSPQDVKNEVRKLKELFLPDKRCILCPSNAIQPETPWENVIAFIEEAGSGRPAEL